MCACVCADLCGEVVPLVVAADVTHHLGRRHHLHNHPTDTQRDTHKTDTERQRGERSAEGHVYTYPAPTHKVTQ